VQTVAPDAASDLAATGTAAGKTATHMAGSALHGRETSAAAQAQLRRAQLAAQREVSRLCTRQYGEAAKSLKAATDSVLSQPEAARLAAEGLTRALLDKMLIDDELCIRVLADARADRATAHALNVAVVSLLMGRVFGFSEDEMLDVGVGALLHDIGKLELPDRVRQPDPHAAPADQALYREHVVRGVAIGKQMGLNPGALLLIGQHHEMADGSGFPKGLNVDRMHAAARIVALVNRYDNLCDPAMPAHALTPHEALSLIFAQTRSKFDASMLNAFIRMMGVYPPGSVVQLTDDRFALVTNVNSTRPLKPRVLVFDPQVPADEALHLNLEQHSDVGIRRSLRAQQLPDDALHYLAPQQRVIYFFEPALPLRSDFGQEIAA
jgi:putative nucleotidyltransferase with HDIG domain